MNTRFPELLSASPAMITGRQLKAARIFANYTQEQLAKQNGVSTNAIIKWEARGLDIIQIKPHRPIIILLIEKLRVGGAIHRRRGSVSCRLNR